MSQKQTAVLSNDVEQAALKAVYILQYNTPKAASFIRGEVPAASYEIAVQAIQKVVKVQKKRK